MRLITIIRKIILCCLLSASSLLFLYGQDNGAGKYGMSLKNRPLKEVFERLERDGGYAFLYSRDILDAERRVTVDLKDASVEDILRKTLPAGVGFRIEDRQVILYRDGSRKPETGKRPDGEPRVVSGTVTDSSGQPVPGVAVMEAGTHNGTLTDIDGKYGISLSPGHSLVFSSLGYKEMTLKPGAGNRFDVTLQDDVTVIDEVVVVGYGTQSKASVTGALTVVEPEKLVKAPVSSITNLLAGAAPGVSTVQTSGQPGADAAKIYIRGMGSLTDAASSPLVLVDGVERDFSQIDPNEIENFSILKDASSTAVFGIRGANGVILITTRSGKEGKPSITVSSNTGVQQPMSYVQQTGSYEYARFWNIKNSNDGITDKSQYFTREAIEAYRTGSDPIMYPNVKWADLMFNKVFLQTKNNVNISGGGRNVRYFVSLGWLWQNGMLKQTEYLPYDNNYRYNRYNYRANIDFNVTPTTTLKFRVGGIVGSTREPRTVANENQWVYATVWAVPMAGPGFIDGKRTLVPSGFIPKVELRDGYSTFFGMGYNQYMKTTLNMDFELEQKLDFITKGLALSFKGAYDNSFSLNKYRIGDGVEYQRAYYRSYLEDKTKPQTDLDYDKTIVYVPQGSNKPLRYEERQGRDRNWYVEAKLDWSRSFGDDDGHKVTALVLYNQSRDYYPTLSNGTTAYAWIPRSYVGFVGRATYGYMGRYLLDFNIGYNGSENFAPGKTRYGAFPSVSAGWVMTEEEWMKGQDILTYFKLRASYGRVGNDRSNSRFMYTPAVWSSVGDYSFGVSNSAGQPAFGHSVPGNEKVTWETADKQNYGLDLTMFRHRLSFSADFFSEYRTGILMTPNSIPAIIATTSPALNIGKVRNRGYELSLGWKDGRHDFNWWADANMSFARNRIVFMDEVMSEYDYQNQTGGPSGRYTGVYKFERIYQYSDFTKDADGKYVLNPSLPQPVEKVQPGDAMYADLNGDNVVNSDDKMVTGYSARPEYVFGLNAGLTWKGLSFSMQWTGAAHVDKMLQIEYRIPYTNAGMRGLLQYFYDGCWSPENQSGTLPRAAEATEGWNSENSTLWLRDASYLRLKTVTLGYTFTDVKRLSVVGIKSIGLSFSGYNLLTFTPLDIMDPESSADNNGGYPLVKIYSFGLNITF